jgi:hypothetical protein
MLSKLTPGSKIKVINCKKNPSLNDKIGTLICKLEYPNHIMYGASFEYWLLGHKLGLAKAGTIKDELLDLVSSNNCWWLEEDEIHPY